MKKRHKVNFSLQNVNQNKLYYISIISEFKVNLLQALISCIFNSSKNNDDVNYNIFSELANDESIQNEINDLYNNCEQPVLNVNDNQLSYQTIFLQCDCSLVFSYTDLFFINKTFTIYLSVLIENDFGVIKINSYDLTYIVEYPKERKIIFQREGNFKDKQTKPEIKFTNENETFEPFMEVCEKIINYHEQYQNN